MRLILLAAAALSFASSAWAGQTGASPATGAATAAADKVYPPLPTLSMLPPSSGDDDDDAARPHAAGHKKKPHRADCRCSAPSARLVVSDASRAYLQGIERQLDVALAR